MDLLAILTFFWNLILVIYGCVYQVVVWIINAVRKTWQYFQQVVVWIINAVKKTWQYFQGWIYFILKIEGPRVHIMVIGNNLNCHKDILSCLGISQDEVISVDQSDVIIAFVPIVTRAGTDIQAALQKIPENRPAVFIVLHHTYDPDYIHPDSSRAVHRSNVFSVDLVFHEDQGVLNCPHNTKALEATKKYLQDIQVNYNHKFYARN